MKNLRLTQLNELEAEAIFVIREVVAQFMPPAIPISPTQIISLST
jgi:hypothetical protein